MLYIVGLGPGSKDLMTQEALDVIEKTDTIVGYATYVRLVQDMLKGKELVVTGMRGEIERCKKAIEIAQTGKDVAIISSGDAGIYGMAGLVLELASKADQHIDVKVVPGVTASIGAAAALGAPLMNDFCHISLSDLMTPWDVIKDRVDAAAKADFVICLYNPRSKGRPNNLHEALAIILKYKSEDTVVGIGKDVARKKEIEKVTTIKDLDEEEINMTTIVIVGNKNTYVADGRMVTPRGYTL
ncbi:cobalt-precorrin-3B C(17)-methyltransferase [Secundilactobacillus paracollinoides]|uniref:Cobalt-precorrin-3B C(17)-methyltransferase n=1 Tax=Secundilactobacillus paracollinoides TaxID=240427 RepID=A0A1B2IYK4_9LACO|nr:precorrin-3B C(17)-methyltransferase [Secundilactobacillus paracollinoides]ANZ61167.1 cobalt-precorrin-3B C(17)-methyltransferase [Secundilactobacillus paracollinoides]ANZ64439.1 cobalt-precorrin-3B C(17)-methyltransferase [Secundilactobacillus paracollinoides]ANZ67088.1 cobalt-precorrin-3B C(17)-methyltransferase [Secundilactobacillus paracollinoides]KRL76088.1 precorrin-3B C(17)-methyltransferase [Secundilactobacillus paracollinoides DSM 15502 = JCM 11969]